MTEKGTRQQSVDNWPIPFHDDDTINTQLGKKAKFQLHYNPNPVALQFRYPLHYDAYPI